MPLRPDTKRIAFCFFYLFLYGFIYAGWLCHESSKPAILLYSKSYAAFLAVMAFGFFVPAFFIWFFSKVRAKSFLFAIGPALVIIFLVYILASIRYSWTQTHLFDPYLQANPKRLDIQPKDSEKTIRILFLGGSTTEGESLPQNNRYPETVGRILQNKYPRLNFEVFNAGTAWYTAKHSLITYTTYYRKWKPDIVVIMHAMNDLYRSFSPQNYAIGPYDPLWNHFYGPSIHGARPPSFETALLTRIKSLPLFGTSLKTIIDSWYSKIRFKEIGYPLSAFQSLDTYRHQLNALVELARRDGAKVAVVSEPSLYKPAMLSEEKDILKFNREVCSIRKNIFRTEYPTAESLLLAMQTFNQSAQNISDQQRALFIDADSRVPKDLEHFTDDVHHTVKGAKATADLVAESISALLTVPAA